MLVLTPVPAHTTSYAHRAPASTFYSEVDYYDAVAQQAAQDYAAARARVRAIEQQREQLRQQRTQEEAARRQAALDDYYRQQSQFIAASVQSYAPVRRPSTCAIEELSYSVRREEERRRVLLARQREAQRARAFEEVRKRQEAERRYRVRLEAQQAREEEAAILAFLGLSAVIPEDSENPRGSYPSVKPRHNASAVPSPSESIDNKGKGKAVDATPATIEPAPKRVSTAPSFKEELEARIRSEHDAEVRESLVRLYSDIFDQSPCAPSGPVAGPSSVKSEEPITHEAAAPPKPDAETSATEDEGAHLHRAPALPPAVAEKLLKFYHARRARKLSLTQIKDVEDALRQLQSAFEFPAHLDFVNLVSSNLDSDAATADSDPDEPGALAYTPNNTPVHAYEHALNQLLVQLDAIESNGDLQVRGRRKEVVREVERALEDVERRVEESRERERERSRERRRSAASSPLATSPESSDTESESTQVAPVEEVTVEVPVQSSTPALATPATEVPEADTVSVALVDTPSPADGTSASQTSQISAAEPDTVSVALVDGPSPISDVTSISTTPVQKTSPSATKSVDCSPAITSSPIFDAPEADTVSMSLVDLPAAAVRDSEPSPTIATPAAPLSVSKTPDAVSPVTPSEPSDATFVTAPSTLPSTVAPTPEAISRATSTATDATFVTADVASAVPSPVDSEPAAGPEPATRVPSASPSMVEDTFLLSSTPLADGPVKKYPVSLEDDLEVISKDEIAAKSDSEWSDVESS
ncbi:hypothetical protein BN946_scf184902.g17 [Trametes cinnabarina]|uniref:BAG domain-containing protein n=1 Tax=Pycnoporus cinnabarinus TaxID=5643 RepID=A0A060SY63_PYCCI|nr:hypothetical protein BN946_scf184902.g17 [Trametes cinnabarina]